MDVESKHQLNEARVLLLACLAHLLLLNTLHLLLQLPLLTEQLEKDSGGGGDDIKRMVMMVVMV